MYVRSFEYLSRTPSLSTARAQANEASGWRTGLGGSDGGDYNRDGDVTTYDDEAASFVSGTRSTVLIMSCPYQVWYINSGHLEKPAIAVACMWVWNTMDLIPTKPNLCRVL